ncbi:MAG: hypothetical protein RSB55_09805, partial [Oscillospiraceae bacterium]
IWMKAGAATAYTIPLPTISNAGAVTYAVKTVTDTDKIFSKVPEIVGTNLTFTSAAVSTGAATVVITIASGNYQDFEVTLKFAVTSKTTVAITGLTAQNGTYDGNPHSGYTGTISVAGNLVPTKQLVYTYTGIGGTVYSDSKAPTNAGSYRLTIAVPDSNQTYTGSHAVITFTVDKAPVTVAKGTYTVTRPWNGTTHPGVGAGDLRFTGGVNREAVTAIPRDYPGSHAGDYAVTVDLALTDAGGNYALKKSTVEVAGTIARAAAYIGSQADAPALAAANDVSVRLQTVAVDGETVEYAKSATATAPTEVTDWQTGTDFGNLTPSTQYYFFARVQENGNHPAGATSSGTAISTAKGVHPQLAVRDIPIVNGTASSGAITLKDVFGENNVPQGAAFQSPVGTATLLQSFARADDTT